VAIDQKLVERLKNGYEAFNRGDFEAALEAAVDDIELRVIDSPSGTSVVSGRDAVIEWMKPDMFAEQRATPVEFIEAADDTIIVRLIAQVRGAGSGLEIEDEVFHVWWARGDLAERLEVHLDRDGAYRAAGLEL
jgi:ketosteroid isomerase-like protein